MKKILVISALLLSLTACSKDSDNDLHPIDPVMTTVLGNWKSVLSYTGTGASDIAWMPVVDTALVHLHTDSTYASFQIVKKDSVLADTGRFYSESSSEINFISQLADKGDTIKYAFSVSLDSLQLSNLRATEGASVKFIRY